MKLEDKLNDLSGLLYSKDNDRFNVLLEELKSQYTSEADKAEIERFFLESCNQVSSCITEVKDEIKLKEQLREVSEIILLLSDKTF